MADHDGRGAADGQPVAIDRGIDPDQRQTEPRQHADGQQRLADVDHDHAEREAPALRAQRVGAAGVAAALLADVHAAQPPDEQAAEQRAQQVGEQCLDAEFEHDWILAAILAAANRRARPRTLAAFDERRRRPDLGKLEQDFAAYRARMNERVLAEDNRVIKRIYSVDSLAYGEDGTLPKQTKELLGLVASLVLRCDDCVKYHLVESHAAGLSRKEIVEAMSIGLVVGGTIVIPHLRRAVEFLDDLEAPQT